MQTCEHQCTGNCRREGCKCVCPGEFHEPTPERTFTPNQEAIIKNLKDNHHDNN